MAPALIDVLPDFGKPAAGRPLEGAEDGFSPIAPEPAPRPAGTGAADEGAEARTQARIEAAERALAERLRGEHEAALEAERKRHAEEMEALQAQLAEEAGRTMAARFAETESRLTALTTTAAARMLGVVLSEDLQRRSLAALENVIREALADREAVRVRVTGAPALWEALRKGLGEKADHVDFSEAPGFDLSLSIDEQQFETRLGEWSKTLSEVVS